MLIVKEGDLFKDVKGPAVIAHGCNAKGKMGAGFASKLKTYFPQSYLRYLTAHREEGLSVGEYMLSVERWRGVDYHIAHLIVQADYGRDPNVVYVDYDAVESCLGIAAEYAAEAGLPIHFPFIGGGLANGNRDTLMKIFESVFAKQDGTLWLPKAPNGLTFTFQTVADHAN